MINLPVPAGGAVVPYDGGAAYVGDMSVDRGAPASIEWNSPGGQNLAQEMGRELGVSVSAGQLQKAEALLQRRRLVQDERDKQSAVENLRREWGSTYDTRLARINSWLATLPEALAKDLRSARDSTGTPIFSKPVVLRALYDTALAAPIPSDDERDRAEAERALRTEWGHAYDSNTALLKQWLAGIPLHANEGITDARDWSGTAILNRPVVLKWMLQLATRTAPGAPRGEPPANLSARRREIENMMRNPRSDYYRGPNAPFVQAEYRQLVDQGIYADGIPNGASSNVDGELREIEKLMRNSGSKYYRGPEAERLQARYRELIEQRGRN